jgi:hypothetical protein
LSVIASTSLQAVEYAATIWRRECGLILQLRSMSTHLLKFKKWWTSINNYRGPPFLEFEFVEAMGDKAVQDWTGLDVAQFNQLFLALPSLNIKEKVRPKTALGLWLAKYRTGETNERLSTLVNLTRPMVENLMAKAKDALASEWVPVNLGFSRINREFL